MLKPWGEKEQIMIPYSYTENGDTFEDYLTLIYEKTIYLQKNRETNNMECI